MCQYVENVEQTIADICEIHLILLKIFREFKGINSDFRFFFQKKQEIVLINLQTQQKVPFSLNIREIKQVLLAKEWNNQVS